MANITLLLPIAVPVNPVNLFALDEVQDFCKCDFRCNFEELVFASLENDGYKNDYTDFLFKRVSPSDSITYEIWRNGVRVTIVADDTYGRYYDAFEASAAYSGWVADWTKIYQAFSGGLYQIKVVTVIVGQSSTFESRYFRLSVWDAKLAHNTVKIKSVQKGTIESSGFSYDDLLPDGWESSIRLYGTFGEMEATINRDIYLDSNYREIQNRDTITRSYTLRCNIIPDSIYDRLATKDMLGNEVFITSYDLFEEKQYRNYPVVPDEFSDNSYLSYNRLNFSIKFSDRQKNINKRNF